MNNTCTNSLLWQLKENVKSKQAVLKVYDDDIRALQVKMVKLREEVESYRRAIKVLEAAFSNDEDDRIRESMQHARKGKPSKERFDNDQSN